MKEFIQPRYMFPDIGDAWDKTGYTIFFVTIRDCLSDHSIKRIVTEDMAVEERKEELQKMVEKYRPDLAGCIVCGLVYQLSEQLWEIAVLHENLPRTPMNEKIVRERLIPQGFKMNTGAYEPAGFVKFDKEESWRDREPLL